MDDLKLFMHVYMYELEICLSEHQNEIFSIPFQSDEANPDRPLKEYIKHIIENRYNHIDLLSEAKYLEICGDDNKTKKYLLNQNILSAKVENAFLFDELPQEALKYVRQRKNAVFTKPDLCLAVRIGGKLEYETLELKSTKTDAIPGSSVQQILPSEWVIFVKHDIDSAKITTGQYCHAINAKMQFPDRSPRPQLSFKELQKWNSLYRSHNLGAIVYHDDGDNPIRYKLLKDWQGVLAERWTEVVFDRPKGKEPWFNNNLRKFILEFLEHYDEMTPDEKKKYKEFLESVIDK